MRHLFAPSGVIEPRARSRHARRLCWESRQGSHRAKQTDPHLLRQRRIGGIGTSVLLALDLVAAFINNASAFASSRSRIRMRDAADPSGADAVVKCRKRTRNSKSTSLAARFDQIRSVFQRSALESLGYRSCQYGAWSQSVVSVHRAFEGDVIQFLDRDFESGASGIARRPARRPYRHWNKYPVAEALASCILSVAIAWLSGYGPSCRSDARYYTRSSSVVSSSPFAIYRQPSDVRFWLVPALAQEPVEGRLSTHPRRCPAVAAMAVKG